VGMVGPGGQAGGGGAGGGRWWAWWGREVRPVAVGGGLTKTPTFTVRAFVITVTAIDVMLL
jgi:hypothetical protein